MLAEQTIEKLVGMKLHGMAHAFRDWLSRPKDKDLAPADLLGLLADAKLEFEGGKLVGWKSKTSSRTLKDLVEAVQPEKRTLSSITVGLNPLMKYENGQDRMVSGAIGLGGFGFSGIVRRGSLSEAGTTLVQKGKLTS